MRVVEDSRKVRAHYFNWVEVGKDLLAVFALLIVGMALYSVALYLILRWTGIAL